jgi:hypothetical protein
MTFKQYLDSLHTADRTRLLTGLIGLPIVLIATYLIAKYVTGIVLVFALPIVVLLLLFLADSLRAWLWPAVIADFYGEWHGNWYEYDMQQIRVLEEEGSDALWIVASDCYKALDLEVPRNLERRFKTDEWTQIEGSKLIAFNAAGIDAFVRAPHSTKIASERARKFGLWVHQQVLKPHAKKREIERDRAA